MNITVEELNVAHREQIARSYFLMCGKRPDYLSHFENNTENFRNVIKDAIQKQATKQGNLKEYTVVLVTDWEEIVDDIVERISLLMEFL